MSSGNAKIGQLAPDFASTAVVDGQFKDVKLSDYRGNAVFLLLLSNILNLTLVFPVYVDPTPPWVTAFLAYLIWADACLIFFREVCGLLLLPPGLHVCVSHWDRGFQRQGRGVPQSRLRGYRLLHRLSLQSLGVVRIIADWKEINGSSFTVVCVTACSRSTTAWLVQSRQFGHNLCLLPPLLFCRWTGPVYYFSFFVCFVFF